MIKFINYQQTYPQELWKRNVGPKRQAVTVSSTAHLSKEILEFLDFLPYPVVIANIR